MELDLNFIAPVLAAIVTAGIGGLVTYFSMRRAKSGRINSSEADVLWSESGAIRRELREQIQQLEVHLAKNEAEIAALRAENAELKHEVLTLRSENAGLKVQIEKLREENVELRAGQKLAAEDRLITEV